MTLTLTLTITLTLTATPTLTLSLTLRPPEAPGYTGRCTLSQLPKCIMSVSAGLYPLRGQDMGAGCAL